MTQLGSLEAGSRYDLRVGASPDAPDEADLRDDEGVFGYAHSYESSSRYDGPGVRVVLFVSGCLLRCTYCHNPDTWHLKDGTRVSVQQVLDRLKSFAPALRALDGGLTISGGEPRSEEHTSELQSLRHLVCRLLLEKKKTALQYMKRLVAPLFWLSPSSTCPLCLKSVFCAAPCSP